MTIGWTICLEPVEVYTATQSIESGGSAPKQVWTTKRATLLAHVTDTGSNLMLRAQRYMSDSRFILTFPGGSDVRSTDRIKLTQRSDLWIRVTGTTSARSPIGEEQLRIECDEVTEA